MMQNGRDRGPQRSRKRTRSRPASEGCRRCRPHLEEFEQRLLLTAWTGQVSPYWSVKGNWDGNVPGPGDTLVFPAVAADKKSVVDNILVNGEGLTVGQIQFQDSGYSVGANFAGAEIDLTLSGSTILDPVGGNSFAAQLALRGSNTVEVDAGADTFGSLVDSYSGGTSIPGSLTKTGAGEMSLLITDSYYSGGTVIAQGRLTVPTGNDSSGGPLGSGTVTVEDGATLNFPLASIHPMTNELVLNGLGQGKQGALIGLGTWSGPIQLATTSEIHGLTLKGPITGPGGLILSGLTTFAGSSDNAYQGTTTILGGGSAELHAGTAKAIPGALTVGDGTTGAFADWRDDNQLANPNAPVTVNPEGILSLNGHLETMGSLTMTAGTVNTGDPTAPANVGTGRLRLVGDVTVNASKDGSEITGKLPVTLTGGVSPTFTVAAGTDLRLSAPLDNTGSSGLIKAGPGTMILFATNTYTGPTQVKAGTLFLDSGASQGSTATEVDSGATLTVDGSAAQSTVTVLGGTLGGQGTVGNVTVTGGTIQLPALPSAALHVHNLQLDTGSTFAAKGGFLDADGSVDLGDSVLVLGNYAAPVGTQFTLIKNETLQPIQGHFKNLLEGDTLMVNGQSFQISYRGGASSSDVVLTRVGGGTVSPPGGVSQPVRFRLDAPANAQAGDSVTVNVTAVDSSNAAVTSYTGMVHLSGTPAASGLPVDYTFTTADQGSHSFNLGVQAAGPETLMATDSAANLSGTTSVQVRPAGADHLTFSQQPSDAVVGSPLAPPVVVSLLDPYNNVVTTATGTVTLALAQNPTQATLSGNSAFFTGGQAVFSRVVVSTPGTGFTLTASGAGLTLGPSRSFTVTPAVAQVGTPAPTPAAPAATSGEPDRNQQLALRLDRALFARILDPALLPSLPQGRSLRQLVHFILRSSRYRHQLLQALAQARVQEPGRADLLHALRFLQGGGSVAQLVLHRAESLRFPASAPSSLSVEQEVVALFEFFAHRPPNHGQLDHLANLWQQFGEEAMLEVLLTSHP